MSYKLGRRSDFSSVSLQLDPRAPGSRLHKPGKINSRVATPYRCVYTPLGHIHIPSYRRKSPFLKTEEEGLDPNQEYGYTEFPDSESASTDNWDDFDDSFDPSDVPHIDPEVQENYTNIRSRVEGREEGEDHEHLDEPITCGHEHVHVDPTGSGWTESCLEHSFEVPHVAESVFGLLPLFRNPPSYDRTAHLRGAEFDDKVKSRSDREVRRAVLKNRLRRRLRKEGSEEGFNEEGFGNEYN